MNGHEHHRVGVGIEVVEVGNEGNSVEIFVKAWVVGILLILQNRGLELVDVFQPFPSFLSLGLKSGKVSALIKKLGENDAWSGLVCTVDYGLHKTGKVHEPFGRP